MDGRMGGWKDGWMEGSQSRVKDCLQQSKNVKFGVENLEHLRCVEKFEVEILKAGYQLFD